MYRKILVPLDGSPLAEAILPQVQGLAKLTGAEICLLRVALVHTFPGIDATDKQVAAVERAENYLGRIAERLAEDGISVSARVRYGRGAEEIVDCAATEDIDLVAMSTHGRSGVGRWAMGSVAEKVVRASTKPVLLIRAGKGAG